MSPHHPLFQDLPRIRWQSFCLGGVATGVLASSVHAAFQQVFDVPYPKSFPQSGWGFDLKSLATCFGIFLFCRLAQKRLNLLSLAARCLVVFLLVTTLRELFFRIPFMNGGITGAWLYALIENILRLLTLALCAALVWICRTRAALALRTADCR